jgi:hypothetical protein
MCPPVCSCSTSTADDLNGSMLSECEQLKVNTAASQLPVKQQLKAVYINNAGHQLAGRRTDLAYQTWAMMAIFRMRARPVHITMFNLATRQGKTAQGTGFAANKHALQQLPSDLPWNGRFKQHASMSTVAPWRTPLHAHMSVIAATQHASLIDTTA